LRDESTEFEYIFGIRNETAKVELHMHICGMRDTTYCAPEIHSSERERGLLLQSEPSRALCERIN
jgi:hypothetical protein